MCNWQHDLPEKLVTDLSRMEQIIKNLLSNAFKFTPAHGQHFFRKLQGQRNERFFSDKLKAAKDVIAIKVKDSGIGIPEDKAKTDI